jgi:hypothetical protein
MYARNVLMCLIEFLEVFQKCWKNYANQYIVDTGEKTFIPIRNSIFNYER